MIERTRVLLVEDNVLFRAGLAQILEADGRFRVVGQVSDGADALPAVKQLAPDLVLIDLNMPVMDGIEAIRLMRTDTQVPIGVLSVFSDRDAQRSAIAAGANGYLGKDSTSEDLCEAAARMAHGEEVVLVPARGAPPFRVRRKTSGALARLTARELGVMRALAGDSNYDGIAADLDIRPKTLRNHISNIYRKLQISNRAQAVIIAMREGLVNIDSL